MENLDYELLRFEISKIGSSMIDLGKDVFKSSGFIGSSVNFNFDSLKKKLLYLVKCQVYFKFKYIDYLGRD
jgi:hypothetical protein